MEPTETPACGDVWASRRAPWWWARPRVVRSPVDGLVPLLDSWRLTAGIVRPWCGAEVGREYRLHMLLKTTGQSLSLGDWAGVAAAVIALIALLVAVFSFRVSGRALRLSEVQEERRGRGLELYLEKAVSYRARDATHRLLACSLLVTNPADSANAIVSADLHVTYSVAEGVVTTLKVPNLGASASLIHRRQPRGPTGQRDPRRPKPSGPLWGRGTQAKGDGKRRRASRAAVPSKS
jgi:hypothetical protein